MGSAAFAGCSASWLRRGAAVGAGALVFVFATAFPAAAEVSGPCRGTIKGVDVASRSSTRPSDAIEVSRTENIAVAATSTSDIDRYKIQLTFAGVRWTVAKGAAEANSWNKNVNVKPYARYGVGLYKVSGISSGAASCTGAALVRVKGSPFGSVAGVAGAALSVIGIGAVARTAIQGFRCGPKPVPLSQSVIVDPGVPVHRVIADVKGPRSYVELVESICTYNPARFAPVRAEICGGSREVISQICRWG
ncbi:MAG TPA: hypothetical protein VM143_01795 [Acidimicrobiales bacterium]|nr:hypothetical protein [Acidimicrobiales bacterium]